ncbi:HlyC/CorC family transporter [Candidatus Poribacteria bacterium]|nr:HlyC/CorC family transporter [Candidatus Poribacteria bacterium]
MDDLHITTRFILLGILLILNALFSAAEALLTRLTRTDILEFAEEGGKRYDVLTSLLRYPRRYSITIITAKTLLIVASVLLIIQLPLHPLIEVVIATFVVVVFTELFPKNYVQGSPSGATIQALRALRIVYWCGFLILTPLNFIVNLLVRVFGGKSVSGHDSLVSPEVLETLDNVADSQNILEPDDREMISRILDLPDKVAREIMVARTDMVCLDLSTPEEEVLQTTIECRHTRIPIYEETIDQIVGILHVKDMLDCWGEDKPVNLKHLIVDRQPFFTPESKKISELFRELREHKQHIAIVVDEYGGTAGIITLENIIEEIVGEIQDEDEADEQDEYVQISSDVYSVDARLNLVELNEKLETDLEAENIDTIGGFVVDHLGRVPEQNEEFTYRGINFRILEADERRIQRVQIQMPMSTSTSDNSEDKN